MIDHIADHRGSGQPVPTAAAELAQGIERLERRFAGVEELLGELREVLVERRKLKESYTTAEAAELLGKRPYTVREWCRFGRVNATKAMSGRGLDEEWRISHEELERIRNEGLLSLPRRSR